MRELFNKIDADKSGAIDKKEMTDFLRILLNFQKNIKFRNASAFFEKRGETGSQIELTIERKISTNPTMMTHPTVKYSATGYND